MALPGAAECAQTCEKCCRQPAPSGLTSPALVEGGAEGSGAAARGGVKNDLAGPTAAGRTPCLEPCEAMCMSACELRQRDVRSEAETHQAALALALARAPRAVDPAPVASDTVVEFRS